MHGIKGQAAKASKYLYSKAEVRDWGVGGDHLLVLYTPTTTLEQLMGGINFKLL